MQHTEYVGGFSSVEVKMVDCWTVASIARKKSDCRRVMNIYCIIII